jgi:hypothetical protein
MVVGENILDIVTKDDQIETVCQEKKQAGTQSQ